MFHPWLSNQQFRETSRPGLMSTDVCLNLCWQAAEHEGSPAVKEKKRKHMQRELIALERHKKTIFQPFHSHSYFNPVDLSSSKQESNVNELLMDIIGNDSGWQKSITKVAKRQPSSSLQEKSSSNWVGAVNVIHKLNLSSRKPTNWTFFLYIWVYPSLEKSI